MYAVIKRILDLAARFSAQSHTNLLQGMVFNVLKGFFMAGMLGSIWWATEHLHALNGLVALQCLGMLLVSIAGQYACQYMVDIKMDAEGFHIFRDLRLSIGDQLKSAPMGFFSEQKLAAITTTLTTTVHQLEEFMTICMTGLSGGVAMAIILGVSFLFVAPPIAGITFLGIAAGLLVLNVLLKRSGKATQEVLAAQEVMSDAIFEYAQGMAVLRMYTSPDKSLAKAKDAFEMKRAADEHQEASAHGLLKLYVLVFNLASCGVLFAACVLYLNKTLSLSWTLTLLAAAFMIYGELIIANNSAFLTKKIGNELNRIDEVCSIPQQDTTKKPLVLDNYNIDLNHVSFSYGNNDVIHDVSLSIPEGTSCAFVGPSGSGKTTLANLISRLWDVDAGTVYIGGHNVREGTAESLMEHISMVFQNVYLFNDTIENNIRFGVPNATRTQVIEAAKRARCHDFIMELPKGYDTLVEEGGGNFSGGEKQRISIARAIMKDAPIVILDEATSNVDPENEHELMAAIQELTQGKTLISIAHRLNTVQSADQILVLDKGRIVQRGTHEKLMDEEGIYRRFITLRQATTGWKLG